MAGMEFEYDDEGGTFYYFLLSFLALLLFPATYYLWPSSKSKDDTQGRSKICQCVPCQKKKHKLKSDKPWVNLKKKIIKLILIIGWIFFIWVAYKASQVELDLEEFDPFKELELDRGATDREVKKAYRKLSMIYHPDRETGDPKKFMKITKAHAALTDEEARKNWEEYGNPDGPGAMQFGIALPKWIVEKQNSVWVLAAYGLVFMIILPVVVGSWWYRSIKFSAEQILMDTMQLYRYFVHKTPNMVLKRAVMILGASFEYEKGHNHEIVNRPSDNEEIPQLMKDLPHLQEKNKEPPLCSPYSVKARALLHAHFSRLHLPPQTLEIDQEYIVLKAPFLLNEMINVAAMLVAYGHARKGAMIPRLDTVENMMRVSQMVVQAVWDTKGSLLQLPHITEDMLRHFVTKRRSIRTVKDFVKMKDEDRRNMLRTLSPEEYQDIMNVCAMMPHVTMTAQPSVLDDEDSNLITAKALVTVNVTLNRQNMSVLFDKDSSALFDNCIEDMKPDLGLSEGVDQELVEYEEGAEASEEKQENESPQRKPKVWEKNKKKKGGKGGKKKKPMVKQAVKKPAVSNHVTEQGHGDAPAADSATSTPKSSKKSKSLSRADRGDDVSTGDESGSCPESDEDGANSGSGNDEDDDDDYLLSMQQEKKKELLGSKSKETHEVHAPYFPGEKYERWWAYIADRRTHQLITAPVYVCSLKEKEDFQIKFTAPAKMGKYRYTVCLRSDSYFMDFDQVQNFEIDVKEEKKQETHPQWEGVTDDEEEDKDNDDDDDSEYDSDDESDN